ncbi:T9SS type A sorting domain-containing protein [Aquimarina longa]|uniref:T9SS type A sorting domain-containing protein n=1 Tax=Aquimarina longa TaxID=1080221 RepID=UPI000785C13A|nr:T9SS type A sorting domain-containing protein [Aquimarina longa]
MKKKMYLLSLSLIWGLGIKAQISESGTPHFLNESKSKSITIPKVIMPLIDFIKIQQEQRLTKNREKDVPHRFAYAHKVNINPDNTGRWFTKPNGDKYWLLEIQSKGAKSLNFTFSDFYLPKGSKLFFYNKEHSDIKGAFTSKNNKPYRKLGITPIKGDNVIIEYYQHSSVTERPALQISTVAHDYEDIFKIADAIYKSEINTKNFGDSDHCNVNASCKKAQPHRNQLRSVALIIDNQGTGFCSAVLINNTNMDKTPYLISANHCFKKFSAETSRFIFNYQSNTCENPKQNPSMQLSISGAQILKPDESKILHEGPNNTITKEEKAASDVTLLKLSTNIPENYFVYYSGWNTDRVIPPYSYGFHHPQGDIKKFSFTSHIKNGYRGTHGFNFNTRQYNFFWSVQWQLGITEGGSSGSPLFNPNGQVTGSLKSGTSYCHTPKSYDRYLKFSRTLSLYKKYLAPNSDLLLIDGIDSNKNNKTLLREELNSSQNISIYPNPVQNNLFIKSNVEYSKIKVVDIIDISGKIIHRKNYTIKKVNDNLLKVSVLKLPKGSYFLKTTNEDLSSSIKKIIISK